MDTGFVTPEQIALIVSREDCADPQALVRRCLAEHGLPVWRRASIALFIRGQRLLLLAQPSPPRRRRLRPGEPRLRRRTT